MIPVGILVLGSIPWRWSGVPLLVLAMVLGSLLGAGLGLVLGTLVVPQRINIVFSLVFTPLLFTGLQPVPVAVAVAPALVPGRDRVQPDDLRQRVDARGARADVPHIAPWVCILVLVGSLSALMAIGVRGFYRRAID